MVLWCIRLPAITVHFMVLLIHIINHERCAICVIRIDNVVKVSALSNNQLYKLRNEYVALLSDTLAGDLTQHEAMFLKQLVNNWQTDDNFLQQVGLFVLFYISLQTLFCTIL